jgi:hypothetical protein
MTTPDLYRDDIPPNAEKAPAVRRDHGGKVNKDAQNPAMRSDLQAGVFAAGLPRILDPGVGLCPPDDAQSAGDPKRHANFFCQPFRLRAVPEPDQGGNDHKPVNQQCVTDPIHCGPLALNRR